MAALDEETLEKLYEEARAAAAGVENIKIMYTELIQLLLSIDNRYGLAVRFSNRLSGLYAVRCLKQRLGDGEIRW